MDSHESDFEQERGMEMMQAMLLQKGTLKTQTMKQKEMRRVWQQSIARNGNKQQQ